MPSPFDVLGERYSRYRPDEPSQTVSTARTNTPNRGGKSMGSMVTPGQGFSGMTDTLIGRGKSSSPNRQFRRMASAAGEYARPGYNIMQRYSRPAFRQAYDAAQNLDNMAAMRGGRALAQQDLSSRMARQGMAGSGLEAAGRASIDRQWGQQLANAQLQANAMKQQAMQSLAGQAMQTGQGAYGMQMQPMQQWSQYKQGAKMQDRAEQAQKEAANQQATADIVGGIAGLAMAPMTGGMSLGGMMGSTVGGAALGAAKDYFAPSVPGTKAYGHGGYGYSGMEGIY